MFRSDIQYLNNDIMTNINPDSYTFVAGYLSRAREREKDTDRETDT